MTSPGAEPARPIEAPSTADKAPLIAVLSASILVVLLYSLTPLIENDFWTQIKVGEIIRESGTIPDTVLFAMGDAADIEFVAYEWLTSVGFSYVHSALGVEGAIIARATLALLAFALLVILGLQINRDPLLSIFVGITAFLVLSPRLFIRPELPSYVFGLLTLNLLQAFLRTGSRWWLLWLIPLSTLWANCHGSFLVGIALPLIFLAGGVVDDLIARRHGGHTPNARIRERLHSVHLPLLAVSLAMAAAALVNPFGWQLVEHVTTLSSNSFIRENILEWMPTFSPDVWRTPGFALYCCFALLLLYSLVQRAGTLPSRLFLLAAVFFGLSIDANRHIAWFAVAGSYVLGYSLAGSARLREHEARNSVLLTVVLLGIAIVSLQLGNLMGWRPGFGDRSPLSTQAVEFMRDVELEGNVFNSYRFGGKLAYYFYPEVRISIDDRIDAYGEDYYRRYQRFEGAAPRLLASGDEFVEYFERNDIELAVMDARAMRTWRASGRMASLEAAGWQVVYGDPTTRILKRDHRR